MATYPNVNDANRYARDVVAGKILACRYVKLACQRHLNDLERAKDQRWPYRFDRDKAERFCRFSQKMPHTSGEWARKKLRLTLEDWQKFCFCVSFGWVRKSDGLRRFQEIYIEVPRKNGKSLIAASVGIYMFCADDEHGAEVYCGATTEKQAFKVFEPARQMVQKLPALRKRFSIKPWAKKMTRPDGSVFAPIVGDPGDGDSPSCAIIDEYHEHATDALYTTMTTGQGAREQPLTLIITTAGYDIASPCYDKRSQVVEILEGIRTDGANETIFGIIYTLDKDDDWTTEEAIRKANPNLGVSLKPEFLRAKQELAKTTPSQTNKILTKHFNLWVSSKAAFYNMQRWQEAADPSLTLFNVPAHMINDLEKATFSNISEQSIQFVRFTIMPWVVNWEQELNRRMFTRQELAAGYYVKFNLAGLLRGTPKERAEFYHYAITDGWLSRNEVRALEDKNPVPGLDEMLVSVNAAQTSGSKDKTPEGNPDNE